MDIKEFNMNFHLKYDLQMECTKNEMLSEWALTSFALLYDQYRTNMAHEH